MSYIPREFTFHWQACSEQLLLAIGENVKGASISSVTHSNKEASWFDNVRQGRLSFSFVYLFICRAGFVAENLRIASITECVRLFLGRRIWLEEHLPPWINVHLQMWFREQMAWKHALKPLNNVKIWLVLTVRVKRCIHAAERGCLTFPHLLFS